MCVCVRACLFWRTVVYAYKKKIMGFVCVFVVYVCRDHGCEISMAFPSVGASATDLVGVLCVGVYVCVFV